MINNSPNLPGLQSPLEEGEPVFVLRARDSMAHYFVTLWAAVAAGDTPLALNLFAQLNGGAGYKYREEPRSGEKLSSAKNIALEMVKWRRDNNLNIT